MNQYEYLQSIYVNTQKYLYMYHLGKAVWFGRARLVAVPLEPFKWASRHVYWALFYASLLIKTPSCTTSGFHKIVKSDMNNNNHA